MKYQVQVIRKAMLPFALGVALLVGCTNTTQSTKSDGGGKAKASNTGSQGAVSRMSLKRLNGGWQYMGDLLGKRVVMVSFWATWCKPCTAELKELGKIQKKLGGKKLHIVAVNTDPPASMGQVRTFVRRNRLGLMVLMDQDSRLLRQLNPKGNLPFYAVFDHTGKLVHTHQGYQPGDEVGISKKLRGYLAATNAAK